MRKVSLVLAVALGATFFAWSQTNGGQAKKSQLDGTWESVAVSNSDGIVQLLGDLTLNGFTRSVIDLDGPSPPQTISGKIISGFSERV